MKTVLLCILCFAVGAVGSGLAVGYVTKYFHRKQLAILYSGEVSLLAMYAHQLKSGEGQFVLDSMEKLLPGQVELIRETGMSEDTFVADTALMSVKRFYVCTKTEIPERIAGIMAEVRLEDDACPVPEGE